MNSYNSLKTRRTLFGKDSTKDRLFNNCDMTKSFSGYDKKAKENYLKHEHCLNWLESASLYEQESKEIDANIQLLMWKKKHMEILHKQKNKDKQTGISQKIRDSSITIASDSPPPLSDFIKPDFSSVSADDGFESAVDVFSNQVNLQHIQFLENELKKRDMKIQMYQQIMNKKQHMNSDIGFLTPQHTNFDVSAFCNNNNTLDSTFHSMILSPKTPLNDKRFFNESKTYKTSTPESKLATRPTSFKKNFSQEIIENSSKKSIFNDLSSSCINQLPSPSSARECRSTGSSMEVLKLKSELLVKEQHLRKTRCALEELSGKYNELLNQHMKVCMNKELQKKPPSPKQERFSYDKNNTLQRLNFIREINDVLDQLHRVFNSKKLLRDGIDGNEDSNQKNSIDMLHQKIKSLRGKLISNYQSSTEDDDY